MRASSSVHPLRRARRRRPRSTSTLGALGRDLDRLEHAVAHERAGPDRRPRACPSRCARSPSSGRTARAPRRRRRRAGRASPPAPDRSRSTGGAAASTSTPTMPIAARRHRVGRPAATTCIVCSAWPIRHAVQIATSVVAAPSIIANSAAHAAQPADRGGERHHAAPRARAPASPPASPAGSRRRQPRPPPGATSACRSRALPPPRCRTGHRPAGAIGVIGWSARPRSAPPRIMPAAAR